MAVTSSIINLDKFLVGPWKFNNVSTIEGCSSIRLEFQYPSDFFTVKVMSKELTEVLGSFTLRRISGQDFSFTTGLQGSISNMSVKVLVELDQIQYVDYDLKRAVSQHRTEIEFEETDGPPVARVRKHARVDASSQGNFVERTLRCHLVTLITDPVEAGNLRDVVIYSTENPGEVQSSGHQRSLHLSTGGSQWDQDVNESLKIDLLKKSKERGIFDSIAVSERLPPQSTSTQGLQLVPTLPFWVVFIPWWLYCKPLRRLIQLSITLYVVLTVMWALWQLHRHFYLIQALLAPILSLLKWYLAPFVTFADYLFSRFTALWYQFINPVYILLGTLFLPAKSFINFIWLILGPIITSQPVRTVILPLLSILGKPIRLIVYILQKSRLNLASLDVVRLQLSIATNVVISSTKSIWFGFLRLFRYSQDQQRKKQALMGQLKESQFLSPHSARRRHTIHAGSTQ